MLLRTDILQRQSLGAPEGRKDVKQEDLSFILTRKNTKKKVPRSPKMRNVFNPHKSFPGRQLKGASRKSLEIQASCIAKQRIPLNRKFVCIKVLRCSNITWK